MRASEITKQNLFEMPFLLAGHIAQPLQDDRTNLRTLARIQANKPTIVRDDRSGTLYSSVTTRGGEYAFLSRLTHKIEYFMQYKDYSDPILKSCATQVSVWRRAVAPRGLTVEVFFDHMLTTFDTMISDDGQTPDGQRFWLAVLVEALNRTGFHIGIWDGTEKKVYDPATDFTVWMTAVDGLGRTNDHWDRRFFITKIAVS